MLCKSKHHYFSQNPLQTLKKHRLSQLRAELSAMYYLTASIESVLVLYIVGVVPVPLGVLRHRRHQHRRGSHRHDHQHSRRGRDHCEFAYRLFITLILADSVLLLGWREIWIGLLKHVSQLHNFLFLSGVKSARFFRLFPTNFPHSCLLSSVRSGWNLTREWSLPLKKQSSRHATHKTQWFCRRTYVSRVLVVIASYLMKQWIIIHIFSFLQFPIKQNNQMNDIFRIMEFFDPVGPSPLSVLQTDLYD